MDAENKTNYSMNYSMNNPTNSSIQLDLTDNDYYRQVGILLALHGVGAVLAVINGIYMRCTRGFSSVRIQNQHSFEIKRPCKIRPVMACNILILYHVVLMSLDLFLAIIHHIVPELPTSSLLPVFYTLLSVNYCMLACCCLPAMSNGFNGPEAKKGLGLTSFEVFNFLVFWLCSFVMTNCYLNHECSGFGGFPTGEPVVFALCPAITTYCAMIVITWLHKDRFAVYGRAITKQTAVQKIQQGLDEQPSVKWTIKCGYGEGSGENAYFHLMCQDTKIHTFQSTNIKMACNIQEEPTAEMFKKKLTKLKICIHVLVGDCHTQAELIESRKLFRQQHDHNGNTDIRRDIQTFNRTQDSYFITETGTTPCVFHPFWYWTFALMGLSLPYRMVIYFSIDHINCRIRKCVYKPDTDSPETSPRPQTRHPDACSETTPVAPPRPTDYSAPPEYPGLPRAETPPPDYEAACSSFENKINQNKEGENIWV